MAKIKLPLRQFYWVNLYDRSLVLKWSLVHACVFVYLFDFSLNSLQLTNLHRRYCRLSPFHKCSSL